MMNFKVLGISALLVATLTTTTMPSISVMAEVQPMKSVTTNLTVKKYIKSISNVSVSVNQRDTYTLPTKISAAMSDNSYQQVAITWNTKKVDTSTVSKYTFMGTVQGYSKTVTLTLVVKANPIVTFKNRNLEKAVRDTLIKPTGTLYKSDVAKITRLLTNYSINDLSGIENLVNLQFFNLGNGTLNDISALKGLTNLKYINLQGNQITDISVLKQLDNLEYINLKANQVTDISSLNKLTNLLYIDLQGNQIADISSLKELTNVRYIDLQSNQITDISALKGLTDNLYVLYLNNNKITDITDLKGLTNLYYLYLQNNKITDITELKKALPDCCIFH